MLDIYELMMMKETNDGHKLLYITICNKEFVFRTLSKSEYKKILSVAEEEHQLEDMICQVGLVYPEEYDFSIAPLAGVSKTVSPMILELSGFTDVNVVIQSFDEYRHKMNTSFEQQCQALVKSAFPEVTFEEMDDWTWDKLLSVGAKAEYILNLKGYDIELASRAEDENIEQAPAKTDKETGAELRANGIDPMIYFGNEFTKKGNYVDFPLIGGVHWQNPEVLNEIRRQMERRVQR